MNIDNFLTYFTVHGQRDNHAECYKNSLIGGSDYQLLIRPTRAQLFHILSGLVTCN